MNDSKGAFERWESQVDEFKLSASYKELTGIDGEPVEFEWKMKHEEFTDWIIFMSMFNDINWTRIGNDGICFSNPESQGICEKILARTLDVPRSCRGEEVAWNSSYTPEGKWDSTATQMEERFKDTGHPVLKSISASSRGILKKNNGRDTIHFNADA